MLRDFSKALVSNMKGVLELLCEKQGHELNSQGGGATFISIDHFKVVCPNGGGIVFHINANHYVTSDGSVLEIDNLLLNRVEILCTILDELTIKAYLGIEDNHTYCKNFVDFVRNEYYELSHDKVAAQRDWWRKQAVKTSDKLLYPKEIEVAPRELDNNF